MIFLNEGTVNAYKLSTSNFNGLFKSVKLVDKGERKDSKNKNLHYVRYI